MAGGRIMEVFSNVSEIFQFALILLFLSICNKLKSIKTSQIDKSEIISKVPI